MKKKYVFIAAMLFMIFQCSFVNNSAIASNESESEKVLPFTRNKSRDINYEHFFKEKKHWCSTMVINCSDFRFAKATQGLINERMGLKGDYDYFSIPGSIRNILNKETIKLVMEEFGISVLLHHVKCVVIIAHEDCIGYGGRETFSSHEEEFKTIRKDLRKARRIMRLRFRDLEVYLFYGRLINREGKRSVEYEQIL
ncbi:carbonic anhydrase [Candidatus Kuenenia sp.]|uniref:carbonic anhydrase n=1 Tax=Candidatus Kuenenia sp. TaxID=2499824 RepID=UPI00321F879A